MIKTMENTKREYSLQFPRQQDKKPVKQLTINERATILLREIIDRRKEKESLFNYIVNK